MDEMSKQKFRAVCDRCGGVLLIRSFGQESPGEYRIDVTPCHYCFEELGRLDTVVAKLKNVHKLVQAIGSSSVLETGKQLLKNERKK